MKKIAGYSFKCIFKQTVIYGMILGVFMEIMNILDYTVGFYEHSQIINNIKYLLRIFGLLTCVIIFRKKIGGYISFDIAFIFCLFTFVFAMLTYDTIICITFNIYPELLHNKISVMREALQNAGISGRVVELSADNALWGKNPYYVIFSFIVWVLFVGPVLSFIFALMVQKNKMSGKNTQPFSF
ncbi:MAG: DUF4199 domain-containing protein [Prevotellaceae bacterium]|jgi:hypothetical protein|nr:DUF4199 domain-containing protein [Prevotellaceae bacterium]